MTGRKRTREPQIIVTARFLLNHGVIRWYGLNQPGWEEEAAALRAILAEWDKRRAVPTELPPHVNWSLDAT